MGIKNILDEMDNVLKGAIKYKDDSEVEFNGFIFQGENAESTLNYIIYSDKILPLKTDLSFDPIFVDFKRLSGKGFIRSYIRKTKSFITKNESVVAWNNLS